MDQAIQGSSDGAPSVNGMTAPESAAAQLFSGSGEMAESLRATDWAQTPLGPVESWSQSLRTAVSICLHSRFPILIWWGPELAMFYNAAYRDIIADKHPHAIGAPGRAVFPEIWDVIGPMLEGVLREGMATWSDDQLLVLERSGYAEECYFTFSYSPIYGDGDAVQGVFTVVSETTPRVLSERRTQTARDLSAALVDARSTDEVCARAARVLATDQDDVPFALLYLVDHVSQCARLAGAAGLDASQAGDTLAPPLIDLADAVAPDSAATWPIARVAHAGPREIVPLGGGDWDEATLGDGSRPAPQEALVMPIVEPGQAQTSAVLVVGVSPMRALDDSYTGFFELLVSHISSGLAAATAYETERRRAEALAQIDRAKTTFFSNISHEFRTPLTLMLGPVEDSLNDSDDPLSPRQRDRLEVIQRNGGRLLKLVNTLLDFARIEAGRWRAVFEPIDLAAYTSELASAFRSLVEKAGMRLVVDCPPLDGLAAPVYVDRDMWEKVVLNLLSNAFKFTLEGSIIVGLHAVEGGQYVELTVRDTGVGIPPDELPRLFERFHRVEGAQSRTHEGSGIGLALVQELIHLHGGEIRVESAVGAGATFFVRLPVGAERLSTDHISAPGALPPMVSGVAPFVQEAERWLVAAEPSAKTRDELVLGDTLAPARPVSAERRGRIVLADDNADMRDYLRRLLSGRYAVEAVRTGTQALAAIRRDPPDLVLSDIMMPELDGFGLLRALRGDPATVTLPVILLSARAGEEATTEGLEAGADDYLVKPFTARELLARVEARLEIARTRAEAQRHTQEALKALLETARWIVSAQEAGAVQDVARELTTLAQRIVGSEIVSLLAVDETGRFIPLAAVGRTPDEDMAWHATLARYTTQDYFSPTQLQQLSAGEVVGVDVADREAHGLPVYGMGSAVSAPLLSDGRLRGILSFAYVDADHQFSWAELELASAFAQMALLALERERLLRERTDARAEALALAEATQRMDEFLGIASHELRTPVTSLVAMMQMAARSLGSIGAAATTLPDEQVSRLQRSQELLERAARQTVRLNRLVGDLIDVTRIKAGKLEMRVESCDLISLVREVAQEQQSVWPTRHIAVEASCRKKLALVGDEDRICQVIINLLSNALKYSPENKPVVIHVDVSDKVARVGVRDEGPGLTPGQQARVWDRFYRVPGIEQQSGTGLGLGLGLHICRTIVEQHGGQVGVDSAIGEGSTFWFTLPLPQDR